VGNSQLLTHQNATHVKHAGSWRVTTTGQKGQFSQSVISQLKLATHPSRKWVARTPYFV